VLATWVIRPDLRGKTGEGGVSCGFTLTTGSSLIGKFLLWLQELIKHWLQPATPTLISGLLSDLPRSRTDLIVENALLRQQLIVLNRQVQRPPLTNPIVFGSCSFPALPDSGNDRCILFSQTPFCAGIEKCFASIGSGRRKANRSSHLRRLL
jgi:hypothetical protein